MALKQSFSKYGFQYHLVKRNENFAIYEQKKQGFSYVYYEVIRITIAKEDYNDAYRSIKKGDEFYPSSNQWGSNGWTYKTLEQSEAKLNQLINDKITL